ncbi:hypothetical protein QCE63_04830 [Caballeronia sp. LZ065]|uniref:hypothetical protein n=1 Tax=Caballeronia sp. LZ065 TaxID=3038571 RepID=UPI00285A63D7|nr:hypothetical protein [Caballeronia sp. LZ065]MDR5778755.1 hypothetical protein [Caballeronia sp. LZ065]
MNDLLSKNIERAREARGKARGAGTAAKQFNVSTGQCDDRREHANSRNSKRCVDKCQRLSMRRSAARRSTANTARKR